MFFCFHVALSLALTDADLRELRSVAPGAAVLTSLDDSGSDTDTASEEDYHQSGLPEPLTALFSPANLELTPDEIHVKSRDTFLRLKTNLTSEQCEKLESVTRQQSKSSNWHEHRAG